MSVQEISEHFLSLEHITTTLVSW